MAEQKYAAIRRAAVRDLNSLLETQQKTEERILQLRNMIAALDALTDSEKPRTVPRLTEAIRSIFKATQPGTPLKAADLRRQLLEMGYDLDRYSNFLASIHVVLKRLCDKGEIKRRTDAKGALIYQRAEGAFWLPDELEKLNIQPPRRKFRFVPEEKKD